MKLPKPIKRGDTYRIIFMHEGKRYSCTRDTAKECEQWAALKLLELKTGKAQEEQGVKPHFPLSALFDKYYLDYYHKTPSATWAKGQRNTFVRTFGKLVDMSIHDITPQHLTAWRNRRSKQVGHNTVLKEISFYSGMFTWAKQELFLLEHNPWFDISKPSKPAPRNRRIPLHEHRAMLESLDYVTPIEPVQPSHFVGWAYLLAIETAMRRGEIIAMQRSDIYPDHIHIPKSKNGTKRDVPLSAFAKELIALNTSPKPIPLSENAFRLAWERRKDKLGFDDLHFHDTRHEAISRMVRDRKLPVEILAKITGHKKIEVLVNTYYNPNAAELVEMFNQ